MNQSLRSLIAVCIFASILPCNVFAEAPVVDESENYALLDEQQAISTRPVAREQRDDDSLHDEEAFANDSQDISTHNKNQNAILLDKIQGLQQDIQELRGQLEVQAHDLKLLQQQQLAFWFLL